MKFDFVIGNPPYQEESETESTTNRQKPRKNIFHYFQLQADEIARESSVLIYPGGRWMHQSGKGLQQFGKDLINDVNLATVEFYPDSSEVFGNTADLADGITIVTKKKDKHTPGFNYIYTQNGTEKKIHIDNPGNDLIPLNPNDFDVSTKIKKFVIDNKLEFLHDAILARSLFGIESDFVDKNPDKVRSYNSGSKIDYSKEIRLLTNDKAGKAGRAKWFIANRDVVTRNREYIDEWQVVVSSANAGGQKRDNQIEIIDNHSAYGRARVGLRSFKSLEEAQNFYNYANTYIVKYAFLMTDEALNSLAMMVPDVQDYSSSNKFIDFKKDLDKQLFKLTKLDADEIECVKNKIDTLRESRGKK